MRETLTMNLSLVGLIRPWLRGMLRMMSNAPMRGLNRATNFMARSTVTRFGIGRNLSREGKKAFLGPYRDRSRRRLFGKLTRDALSVEGYLDVIERALRIHLNDRPVLTIFGPIDPFGFQDRFRQIFPTIRSVVIPKGFHFPMMDNPDLFADSLENWWDEVASTWPDATDRGRPDPQTQPGPFSREVK